MEESDSLVFIEKRTVEESYGEDSLEFYEPNEAPSASMCELEIEKGGSLIYLDETSPARSEILTDLEFYETNESTDNEIIFLPPSPTNFGSSAVEPPSLLFHSTPKHTTASVLTLTPRTLSTANIPTVHQTLHQTDEGLIYDSQPNASVLE